MSRDQLAKIFPDGKTVHLPADGKPFARYEEARAEVLARGGTVLGYTAVASADPTDDGPGIKGFFAGLFGGDSNASPAPTAAATPGKARGKSTIAVASADPEDATGAKQALAYAAPNSTEALREAMLSRQGRETPSAKALLTGEADAAPTAQEVRIAPLPPRRPAEFAAIAAALAAPLPPGRPVKVAGIGDAGLSGMALAPSETAAKPVSLLPPEADPRDHLRALFSASAQGASEPARRDAPIRLAAIQPKADAAPEDIFAVEPVATRFSARSPGDDLAASRFSGSATAPARH